MKADGYLYTENIQLDHSLIKEHDIISDYQHEEDKRLGKEPDIDSIGKIQPLDLKRVAPEEEVSLNERRAQQKVYKVVLSELSLEQSASSNLKESETRSSFGLSGGE